MKYVYIISMTMSLAVVAFAQTSSITIPGNGSFTGTLSTGTLAVTGNGSLNGTLSAGGTITVTSGDLILQNGKVTVRNWTIEAPDYVFDSTYQLPPIMEVEKFVKKNKHLSEIPSATEMKENGLDLTELNLRLLKKVEELTLYVIEQNKKIEKLEKIAVKSR